MEAAAAVYQAAAAQLKRGDAETDAPVNLKRHSLHHMLELLRTRRSVGSFAESAFESWHASVNGLERRYAGFVHNPTKKMHALRKAWLLKTHPKRPRRAASPQAAAPGRGEGAGAGAAPGAPARE